MKSNKLSIEGFSSFSLKKDELATVNGGDFTVPINSNIINQALSTPSIYIVSIPILILPKVPVPPHFPYPIPLKGI
jgi:hypothetical protein